MRLSIISLGGCLFREVAGGCKILDYYVIDCWIIGCVSNETNEDVRMYTWRIYSSRYLDTLLHEVEVGIRITLEEYWFIYTRNKGLVIMRIALREPIDKWELIELQLHEKLSHLRTKLRIVIPLFASLITPGGVNGNPCWHVAHQTAGETIECHSCN